MSEIDTFPSTVMLSDWSADVELMQGRTDAAVHELVLLSILYDEVIIPDEVLALSDSLALGWGGSRAKLLSKILSLSTVRILTHPLSAYPTAQLAELAASQPMLARAKQLEGYGTKGEQPFVPSEAQVRFHRDLDRILRQRPGIARPPAGSTLDPLDTIRRFTRLLETVLSDNRYRPGLQATFGLTDEVADAFALYAAEPQLLVHRLRMAHRSPKLSFDPGGQVLLNRSLIYQGSELYPRVADNLKRLAQSCLAAVTTWKEGAAGRYSSSLRELLLHSSDAEGLDQKTERAVISVRHVSDVFLHLPPLSSHFPDIVERIRTSAEGIALRQLIRNPQASFKEQTACWAAVSKQLASASVPLRLLTPVTARTSLVEIAKHYWQEVTVAGLSTLSQAESLASHKWLESAMLGAGYGLLISMGKHVWRSSREQAAFRRQLEARLPVRYRPVPVAALIDRIDSTRCGR